MNFLSELDEIEVEVFRVYKYALVYIGVTLFREDVQDAIVSCSHNMENAFRRTIEFWRTKRMQHPNAFLISALNQGWRAKNWSDDWLADPNFKSPCLLWWEEAAVVLGYDKRNSLIADVNEDDRGYEYVLFRNGKTLSLSTAKAIGWQRILEFAENSHLLS